MPSQFQKGFIGFTNHEKIEIAGDQKSCQCQGVEARNEPQDKNDAENQLGRAGAEDEKPVGKKVETECLHEVNLVLLQKTHRQMRSVELLGPSQYTQSDAGMKAQQRQRILPGLAVCRG